MFLNSAKKHLGIRSSVNSKRKKRRRFRYCLKWKMRNRNGSLSHFKDINFLLEDLRLIEKGRRSRVKSDKPIFTSQTNLDKSDILLHVVKYE